MNIIIFIFLIGVLLIPQVVFAQETAEDKIILKLIDLESEMEEINFQSEQIKDKITNHNQTNKEEIANLNNFLGNVTKNQEILSENFNEIRVEIGNLTDAIQRHDGNSWNIAFLAIFIGTMLGLGSWILGLAGIIPTRKRKKKEDFEKQARIDQMKKDIPKLVGYVDWFFSEKKQTVLKYNAEPSNRTQLKSQLDGWDTSVERVTNELKEIRNSKLLGIDIEDKIKIFCNYATKISILEKDGTLSIPDEQKVIDARKELDNIL